MKSILLISILMFFATELRMIFPKDKKEGTSAEQEYTLKTSK